MNNKEEIILQNIAADKEHFDMVLSLALDLCGGLLTCGASVNRVEIACQKICLAYGAEEVNVFAFPSVIQASIKLSDGGEVSQMKRIYSSFNNFHKLEVLNQLSRDICSKKYEVAEARRILDEVLQNKYYSLPIVVAGGGIAAGAFTVFFGGSVIDAIPAALIGFLMTYLNFVLSGREFNGYARTFTLSVIGGICSALFSWILGLCGVACNCSMVMIGTIMVVIPGLLVCNAVRDMFAGDLFSGSFELLNGILTTLAIAAGYGASLFALKSIANLTEVVPRTGVEYYVYIMISCIIGSGGFSVMFNCHIKRLLIAMINIIVTFVIYLLMEAYVGDLFMDVLVATLFAATAGEIMARVFKAPSTIFMVPAIMAFVPGGSLYYAISNAISGSSELAFSWGKAAGMIFLGIAVGISVITAIFQLIRPVKMRIDLMFNQNNNKNNGK
jgi:uncharacterized membrane protein YjjP (DUF1212 family)/uncharacterized membrane protein YjjB (DUF3815 family)